MILSKSQVKARPSVLWCYKKELGFSTHRQKRMREIKKLMARGLYDADRDDPFDLFISSTDIRWAYYKDSGKILGQTFGMCVLQDFEALTPNLLCRTIETVEGGGLVILLLKTMSSLKQLYTMTMDVHSRFRTAAHQDVVARFNERFILSLASCETCLVLDDELNVLPISKHSRAIKALAIEDSERDDDAYETGGSRGRVISAHEDELRELKESLADTELVGALVAATRTLDQAKAVLTFAEAISEKTLRSTVALTAGRGRGKSAALGLAIAAAVGFGYSNIFVTSPSPENLGTVFDFVFKGFDALSFTEHMDYEAIQSTNPDFNHAIVRVNIFRSHRQTIQYIQPQDADKLGQAELVVVDEAGAIPLPIVKKLLGPYLVFLSSTINGYEGTGRSLSLKLLSQLREQQTSAAAAAVDKQAGRGWYKERGQKKGRQSSSGAASKSGDSAAAGAGGGSAAAAGRVFREVALKEPIRYAPGDAVEKWLNDLLCLDCTTVPYRLSGGCPHPASCELYVVDRDALLSYHKVSEAFLQRLMTLYVSSHYKNSPNDLQLMSDAPAHRIFALLAPVKPSAPPGTLPDIMCVIQVALEGQLAAESMKASLARGQSSSGDLIPWTMSQQFQDTEFAGLSGARIVRIATHPDATHMGYGSRAMELLVRYFQGEFVPLDGSGDDGSESGRGDAGGDAEEAPGRGLLKEKLKPRKKLPPLLVALSDRKPERLHWLGTSFGVTLSLFNFWRKAGFQPVYVRQTANEITAEHTCIMIKPLKCDDLPDAPSPDWLSGFATDFSRRFVSLLAVAFRGLNTTLASSILACASGLRPVGRVGAGSTEAAGGAGGASIADKSRGMVGAMSAAELACFFTPHDVKRLEAYSKNQVDYHMVVDLLPDLARLYFLNRFPGLKLSHVQSFVLLGLALQHRTIDELVPMLGNMAPAQLLGLFNKAVRKMTTSLREVAEAEAEAEMEPALAAKRAASAKMVPLGDSLSSEMAKSGAAAEAALDKSQMELLKSLDLMEYAVEGKDADWKAALAQTSRAAKAGDAVPAVVSVRTGSKAKGLAHAAEEAARDAATPARQDDDAPTAKKRKKKLGGAKKSKRSRS